MSAGHEAVLIERDPTYAGVSRRLISEHQAELALESTILTLL